MGVNKMTEDFNTKYICDWHESRLWRYIEAHRGETIDLAGCNFTPKAFHVITMSYQDCIFINSENEKLNNVLKHNRQVSLLNKTHIKKKVIPARYDSVNDIIVFMNSLED